MKGKWNKKHLLDLMSLGFVKLDDVQKFRGCHFLSKEDPTIFVDPAADERSNSEKRQWMIDRDFDGFSLAPKKLMDQYVKDRERDSKLNDDERQKKWPMGSSRELAASLFNHMTNCIAARHGWHTGGYLIPSPYLNCEVSSDQRDLLNPTHRDVHLGAILDQCTGRQATKRIAKRRIDIVSGNINSYARILNGPGQLDKIKTYNELAAAMASLQKEKDEAIARNKQNKEKADAEKAAKKMLKESKAKEEHKKMLPLCQGWVEQGFNFVMSLTLEKKRAVLKHVFSHAEAKQTLRLARANEILDELMAPPIANLGDLKVPAMKTDDLAVSGGTMMGSADDIELDINGNDICFDLDGNELI